MFDALIIRGDFLLLPRDTTTVVRNASTRQLPSLWCARSRALKLLDIEKTLSNYILVATGQKHLLMTHRGKEFGVIPSRTPIATLASFSVGDDDVVLAAGEEG